MSNRARFEYIEPLLSGKDVLDLGCVQHDFEETQRDDWFHDLIVDVAKTTVGVDILEDAISELNEQGYEMYQGDVENIRLDKQFDVVFAGELIEHLTDFDAFFETVKHHLRAEGRLVVTTPNAFSVYFWLHRLLGHEFVNPEHTCWFDAVTLSKLLSRQGFEVDTIHHAKMSRLTDVESPLRAKGWLIESALPKRVAHRNLIAVASLREDGADR